jgi:hypothetical protein
MSSIPRAKPSQNLFPSDLRRDNINLIPLTKKMVKKAARSLSLAFFNYPMIEYLFPNEKSRLKRSYHYFKGIINYGRLFGDTYAISQEVEGIIILLSSTMAHYPNKETLQSGIPFQFALSGLKFLLRTRIHEPHQYNIYKKNTNFPHNYFMLLGVHPEKQGSGYAKALINKLVDICDKESLPCYLETYLEKNVEIYKKFGFEVVEESEIPNTTIKFWGLLRQNR